MNRHRIRWAAAWLVLLGLSVSLPAAADASPKSIRERGIELARVAKSRAKAKSFGLAAKMFHEAYNIDRAEFSYLFSAGRCEQLDGNVEKAAATYRRFLEISPTDHKLRPRASAELEKLDATPPPPPGEDPAPDPGAGAGAAKQGVAPPPGVEKSGSGGWHSPVGWGALVIGIVAAGAGGGLFALAADDRSKLEAAVDKNKTATGLITSHTYIEAVDEKRDIERRLLTWSVTAGAGAAVAIVGAVVLAMGPGDSKVQAAMAPDGSIRVGWTMRF